MNQNGEARKQQSISLDSMCIKKVNLNVALGVISGRPKAMHKTKKSKRASGYSDTVK